jgi:uncharacterized protein (DUF1684 family)
MKKFIQLFYAFTVLVLLAFNITCTPNQTTKKEYYSGIEAWRNERIIGLTSSHSWTTLIGLFWLKDGIQSFGADSSNAILFPPSTPPFIGSFVKNGDSIKVRIEDSGVLIDNRHLSESNLKADVTGEPTLMNYKSMYWHVIKRGDRYGIRLRDTLHEARYLLKAIPHFTVDRGWNKTARFIQAPTGQTIPIINMAGITIQNNVEGTLVFKHKGKEHSLLALDGGPGKYFVLVADKTTGVETYGGGRYIYVERANNDGMTEIDFNKLHNPPCVFSDFATCPLPPKQNYLPFAVEAGELSLEYH